MQLWKLKWEILYFLWFPLFDFKTCKVWSLKEGGVYFKVRGISHMKLQILVILSFQITINKYHYDIIVLYGSRYSRLDQVKFVEDSLLKTWSDMVCQSKPYHFEFFKDFLPQILVGPFLNILTHIFHKCKLFSFFHSFFSFSLCIVV